MFFFPLLVINILHFSQQGFLKYKKSKTCYTQTLLMSSIIPSVYFEVLFIDFCLCNQTTVIPRETSYNIHSQ
jgi:hypothetical protein